MLQINNKPFTKHFNVTIKVLIFLFVISLPFALIYILNSPHDYLQGIYAKIMYIHVPSAWLALFWYSVLGILSIGFLVTKNVVLDIYAQAIAPVGATLCLITLITGSIWGKPTWGTWWVWDARLTSMLILFFIYSAYISLRHSSPKGEGIAHIAAVFATMGLINIPIIKFSVDLWNTLHQPASFIKLSGPSIHIDMLIPLLISATNLVIFSLIVILIRLRTIHYHKKLSKFSI